MIYTTHRLHFPDHQYPACSYDSLALVIGAILAMCRDQGEQGQKPNKPLLRVLRVVTIPGAVLSLHAVSYQHSR
jgi:hypothetical protein